MNRLFATVAALLLSLSLLAGPVAQAHEEDLPPVPPVVESEPDSGVMPTEHPPAVEGENY